VLALGAGSALGAYAYPFERQLTLSSGSFGELRPGSVAVDDEDGKTYVADSASGVVDVFETATGTELAPLESKLTPAKSFGGGEAYVAANNATGDVYVLDTTDGVVDVFEPAGGYLCQITGSATPSASECIGGAGSSRTPAGGFSEPRGIAVDQATGEVYVVDAEHGVVDVFGSGGEYLRQIQLGVVPTGFSASETRGVAVDDFNGDVYVSDTGSDYVYVFDAAGAYVATWTGSNTPAGSFGHGSVSVAADDESGEVFVTDSQDAATDVFDASGEYRKQFSNSYSEAWGTAVDQASGQVYVSNNFPGAVDVFSRLLVPDVSTGGATGLVPEGNATLHGVVNPEGIALSSCEFEYGPEEGSYGSTAACSPMPSSGSSPVAVEAKVSVTPGTLYHYRLVAGNANGVETGRDQTFFASTRPLLGGESASEISAAGARLNAQVSPQGLPSSYRFEYGTSTSYGASAPIPDASLAAGASAVAVSEQIAGLSANTTYHWRVVASNGDGTTDGVDHTFIYSTGGGGLPDGREYEMVTPPQKNGALILGGTSGLGLSSYVADDGSRVIAGSLQCFAGSGSCNAQQGGTVGDGFLFSRTGGGWATTPLTPPASVFGDGSPILMVSPDTGDALFSMPTPPFGEDDFYVRRPDGSFVDVGPETLPSAGPQGSAPGAGEYYATADFSHVVWQQEFLSNDWPFDSTHSELYGSSAYEYVGTGNAQPELVGVRGGPGSTELISECRTAVWMNIGNVGAVSADGSMVYFTALSDSFGGGGDCKSTVNAPPVNELYVRIDGERTVLVSGRSPSECTSGTGCLGSGPANAEFAAASEDGSKAFFIDGQQLTDSATGGGANLYEYDFDNLAGHNLIDVSAGDTSGEGPRVQGVTAVSADGSHVYFVAQGVLTGAANSQGETAQNGADNLYVFERDAAYPAGRVAFIATLPSTDIGYDWAGSFVANVTPDGRFLVFESHGRLTADDSSTSVEMQVFRYDAQTGALIRISIGEDGFNDDGNAGVDVSLGSNEGSIVRPATTTRLAGPVRRDPTMSDDGSFVFFRSPIGLTPQALNDVAINSAGHLAENVYEWHEGHVYLISDGRDTSEAFEGQSSVTLLGSDASGADVFFTTGDRLVAQDVDSELDIYDARVCTATEPCVTAPVPAPACTGEACRGAPEAPPASLVPASASLSGVGNLLQSQPSAPSPRKARPVRKAKRKKKVRKTRRAARGRGNHGGARGARQHGARGRS